MKKIFYFLLILPILVGCSKSEIKSNEKPVVEINELEIKEDLTFEYASKVYLYDLINNNNLIIKSENTKINTLVLGNNSVRIEYISNDRNIFKDINYTVVDTTKPLVLINSTLTVDKDTKDVVNKVLCADNYDKRPTCTIEGTYNTSKVGTYENLIYKAIDSSLNTTTHKFKLKVVNPSKSTNSKKEKYKIEDLIKKYKNENTMIGIDVSTWQGKIDYNKVKKAGVEFVMIRIGYGHNKNNQIIMDNQFLNNIKNAKAAGLKVGLYFYSYANRIYKVKEQVNWIVKNLNGEKLDLPIAFDWESWSKFNSYNVSIYDLKNIAQTFIDELKKYGYDAVLYSSKYYLEQIWGINEFSTWLAHYTSAEKSSYKGNYMMWQLSSRGKVSGINGDVDLDILYK